MNPTPLYKKILILSGYISLILLFAIHIINSKEIKWPEFSMLVFVPSIITIPVLTINFKNQILTTFIHRYKPAPLPIKIIAIALLTFSVLFQLLISANWIILLIKSPPFKIEFHLFCYYCTIGFIFTFSTLYQLTAPNK